MNDQTPLPLLLIETLEAADERLSGIEHATRHLANAAGEHNKKLEDQGDALEKIKELVVELGRDFRKFRDGLIEHPPAQSKDLRALSLRVDSAEKDIADMQTYLMTGKANGAPPTAPAE